MQYKELSKTVGEGFRRWLADDNDNKANTLNERAKAAKLSGVSPSTLSRLNNDPNHVPDPPGWEALHTLIPDFVPAPPWYTWDQARQEAPQYNAKVSILSQFKDREAAQAITAMLLDIERADSNLFAIARNQIEGIHKTLPSATGAAGKTGTDNASV